MLWLKLLTSFWFVQGSAKRLINIALRAAAKKHNWRYSDLLKKDKDDHRHLYDDMTVVVLFIDHARLRKGGRGQPLSIRYP
jgi:pyruvate dehydrogenase phosphatase